MIDSKTGIQFMPYHLNEGNQNGEKPTVFVTADMLPRIEKNVRNVDTRSGRSGRLSQRYGRDL